MLARRLAIDFGFFKVWEERLVNPRNGHEGDYYTIDCPDWAVVVPYTTDGDLVMVKQWRFGARVVTIELPGGLIDEGEAPEEAAERELLEETGCRAERWTALGWIHPNPANQRNRCHVFLAEGCAWVGGQALDTGEDIEIVRVTEGSLASLLDEGGVTHAVVLAALHLADRARRGVGHA